MSSSADIWTSKFPTFLKTTASNIASNIDNNIKCIRIEQVWCYECIDWCLYQVVFSLFYTLQRWLRNVKAFEKTIEFFHDVYRETSQLQTHPHPQTNIWRFSWKKSICEASLNAVPPIKLSSHNEQNSSHSRANSYKHNVITFVYGNQSHA
jgi:hypothetical protein